MAGTQQANRGKERELPHFRTRSVGQIRDRLEAVELCLILWTDGMASNVIIQSVLLPAVYECPLFPEIRNDRLSRPPCRARWQGEMHLSAQEFCAFYCRQRPPVNGGTGEVTPIDQISNCALCNIDPRFLAVTLPEKRLVPASA